MTENDLILALQNEIEALQLYIALNNQFGTKNSLLGELVQIQETQANTFIAIANQNGVSIPTAKQITFSSYEEGLEKALIQENSKIECYNTLLASVMDANMRDIFFRYQANSYNYILPNIRKDLALAYQAVDTATQNTKEAIFNELQKGKQLLSEAEGIVSGLKDGTLDQNKLQGFLGNLNYSLIGGIVIGGIATMILNEFLNKDKE